MAEIAEWSEEDKEWLEKSVPLELQATAQKYGRRLYSLVQQGGVVAYAAQVILSAAPPPQATHAIQVMIGNYNMLLQAFAVLAQITEAEYTACKEEMERIGALAAPVREGRKTSPGGIILDS